MLVERSLRLEVRFNVEPSHQLIWPDHWMNVLQHVPWCLPVLRLNVVFCFFRVQQET